ncbi:hypothetical protein [Aureivirga marina]|uniref:hypothetical protein n=1 Tax=Aureivirga marina TaxID=1182451 RepID=UPI0018CB7B40|nr:hypothetical protein [Aureivirga marina]
MKDIYNRYRLISKILILAVLFSLGSCTSNDISWNPFKPNKQMSAELLIEKGLQAKIQITQECWYSLFKENMQLAIAFHTKDDCQISTGQEFIITIPKSDSNKTQNTIKTDSLEINKMLERFDAKISSPLKKEKDKFHQIKYTFQAEDVSGTKIPWTLFDRQNDLELHSTYKE